MVQIKKRDTKSYGKLGEDYAITLLEGNGYRIIDRNFRSKFGEIDIIARQSSPGPLNISDTLVFVEVKTRWSKRFGKPQESVTPRKLYKIKQVAEYFVLTHPGMPKKMRIDVVAIEIENGRVASAKIIRVT